MNYRFAATEFFYYLWLIPVLVVLIWFFGQKAKTKLKKALGDSRVPFLTSSVSYKKRRWKYFLQICTLILMIFALARPQLGQSKQQIKSEGIELIFAVDVSESMLAEDARPSRLDQVKLELTKLVDLLSGNKIGIVAFAGKAALLSPLTTDPASLKMYLESLSTQSVSTQGTNFEQALLEADSAFKRGGVQTEDGAQVTRVVLIASDGEDHEPNALKVANELTSQGLRIFALAYGTEKGAPIPVRDNLGFMRGYKKDRSGNTILTTVKGEALKALAEAGKGAFYFASIGGNHLTNIVSDIDKLEKTMFESEMATQYDERFQTFLLFAFLIGLIELILGDRKAATQIWKGRFEVSP